MQELARVLRANVGSLAKEVLRILDTTNKGVDARVAEARVDEDGTNQLAGGLQEHQAAIDYVHNVLHGGFVVGVFAQMKELAKLKMRREPSVIDSCVFH